MAYGVTTTGFNVKPFDTIIEEMNTRAKDLLGDNLDLSDTSPEGMIIGTNAQELSILWQVAEDTYNSGYKDTSEGTSLDFVGKYIGQTRKPAEKAKVTLTVAGTNGTVVPTGYIFETGGSNTKAFLTDVETTIDSSGTATVAATAELTGSNYNVNEGTIETIRNPLPGLTSVTNASQATGGQDLESDIDFRDRYNDSIETGGTAIVNAILAEIRKVTDDARVFQNNTNTTDGSGRPPKSVEVVVLGGTNVAIANAIFNSLAAGIYPYGSVTANVLDDSGNAHTMRWDVATEVNIYVTLNITKDSNYTGDNTLKDAIISYIGGTKVGGTKVKGLGFDGDIIYNKVIGTAISITGVLDVTGYIGTSPSPSGTSNISISSSQVARIDPTKVVINYV